MITKILPTIVIAISAVAGIAYFISGDYKMGTYWCSAALVNGSATFM